MCTLRNGRFQYDEQGGGVVYFGGDERLNPLNVVVFGLLQAWCTQSEHGLEERFGLRELW